MSFDFSDHNEGYARDEQGKLITMAELDARWENKKLGKEVIKITNIPDVPQSR